MNVKLTQGIAGDGCGRAGFFMPRQIIKCPAQVGARLIAEGMASEAPDNAEIDGEFFDRSPEPEAPPRRRQPERPDAQKPETPPRRRQPERPDAQKPETPESGKPAAKCAGKTTRGNACIKARLPGSKFCARHQE